MNTEKDDNYISVGRWMFTMLVLCLPVIGIIMIFVWALFGHNQSYKNFFRAMFAWVLVMIMLIFGLALLGSLPRIEKAATTWLHNHQGK